MKIKYLILPLLFSIFFSCGGGETSNTSSNRHSEIVSNENNLESLPEISTLEKTYFNYNSYDNYKITLEDINSIAILHYDGIYVNNDNYIFNDQSKELIVSNNYIVESGYGKHIISINETTHYCVVVYDDREPTLVGESTFKYLGQKHPTFEFNLYGSEVTKLIYKDVEYNQYIKSVKNNVLTIDGTFCEVALEAGYNDIKVVIEQDLPNEIKSFEIDLRIYKPKTGDFVPGTPVTSNSSEEIISEELISEEIESSSVESSSIE